MEKVIFHVLWAFLEARRTKQKSERERAQNRITTAHHVFVVWAQPAVQSLLDKRRQLGRSSLARESLTGLSSSEGGGFGKGEGEVRGLELKGKIVCLLYKRGGNKAIVLSPGVH